MSDESPDRDARRLLIAGFLLHLADNHVQLYYRHYRPHLTLNSLESDEVSQLLEDYLDCSDGPGGAMPVNSLYRDPTFDAVSRLRSQEKVKR